MTCEKRSFSSGILKAAHPNMGLMNKTIVALALAGLLSTANAGSQPLDFSYRVTGAVEIKPLLVFNDGTDTFIQPQEGSAGIRVNGAEPVRQGPYYVIRGIANSITMSSSKKGSITIAYSGKNSFEEAPKSVLETVNPGKSPAAQLSATVDEMESGKKAGWNVKPAPTPAVKTALTVPEKAPAPIIQTPPAPVVAATPAASACKTTELRSSAFVVTFKPSAFVISNETTEGIKQLVGKTHDITNVEVISEGQTKALSEKRAQAVKSALVVAGVKSPVIKVTHRAPSVVGTEINLDREISLPCAGTRLVTIPSRNANATIQWNGEAKGLAEEIAKQLSIDFAVQGKTDLPVPVVVSVTKGSFVEAMEQFGEALGDRADFVLSRGKATLIIKGDGK